MFTAFPSLMMSSSTARNFAHAGFGQPHLTTKSGQVSDDVFITIGINDYPSFDVIPIVIRRMLLTKIRFAQLLPRCLVSWLTALCSGNLLAPGNNTPDHALAFLLTLLIRLLTTCICAAHFLNSFWGLFRTEARSGNRIEIEADSPIVAAQRIEVPLLTLNQALAGNIFEDRECEGIRAVLIPSALQ